MDIKSLHFVLFLPIVVFIYYLAPQQFKWLILLLSSILFIAFNSLISVSILLAAIIINFFSAQGISKIKKPNKKQYFLWLVILLNLILLGVFKYYNAINRGSDLFSSLLQIDNPIPHIEWLLPLGISYYIFQSIGYNIEVYRGNELPEKHLGYFSVYLSFFPKLIAGPIERSYDFLPQLKNKINLKYENISHGCRLILWGVFKKMVIAEHLNNFLEPIFSNSEAYAGLPLMMAFLLYTVEIYADFSGYTDIAMGGARLLGFKLTNNFNRPFFASSLTEFWRRWHISLSTWVNDYIFTPLSMWVSIRFNLKKWGIIFSVFFSFLLLGIWHGSAWTFAIFGAIQGIVLAYEILTQKMRKKLSELIPEMPYKLVSIGLTLIMFAFSCIYFKATGIYEAQQWINNAVNFQANLSFFFTPTFLTTIIAVFLLLLFDHKIFSKGFENWCESKPIYIRWGIYMVLLFSIMTLTGVNTYPFIYSNF